MYSLFEMADKHRVNLNKTGTGLGLSISKKIVESLGGKITVVSQEGRWTEFKFTIKIANDASKIEESKQNVFWEEEVLHISFIKLILYKLIIYFKLHEFHSWNKDLFYFRCINYILIRLNLLK